VVADLNCKSQINNCKSNRPDDLSASEGNALEKPAGANSPGHTGFIEQAMWRV
jgi:hypothetical protein